MTRLAIAATFTMCSFSSLLPASAGTVAFAGTTHALPSSILPQPEPTPATKPPKPAAKKGVLAVPDGIALTRDVEYAEVDGKHLLLDIYLPEKPNDDGAAEAPTKPNAAPAPLPVIIWIHGGGWEMGTKDASPAARLVPFGYAAVSISYRFTQVAPYPAQIHDCKAAVRWVRAHAKEYNFDPDHIGVWGASAGGHLVALLGTSAGEKVRKAR